MVDTACNFDYLALGIVQPRTIQILHYNKDFGVLIGPITLKRSDKHNGTYWVLYSAEGDL